MATNCSVGQISAPPWIAEFFHSFQHRNFDFQNVSSVFAPTLPDYQQVGMHRSKNCIFIHLCWSAVWIDICCVLFQMSLNDVLHFFLWITLKLTAIKMAAL